MASTVQQLTLSDDHLFQCQACGRLRDDVVRESDGWDRCEDCSRTRWMTAADWADPLEEARRTWLANPTELRWH